MAQRNGFIEWTPRSFAFSHSIDQPEVELHHMHHFPVVESHPVACKRRVNQWFASKKNVSHSLEGLVLVHWAAAAVAAGLGARPYIRDQLDSAPLFCKRTYLLPWWNVASWHTSVAILLE